MNKLQRDLYTAACIADSLGVSFEFKHPEQINQKLIMNPELITKEYKTFSNVPVGMISDDFSQLMMVDECINNSNINFMSELLEWRDGKYWTNNYAFDCGNQTAIALEYYERHGIVKLMPDGSGNGALMRILPVAFLPYYQIAERSKYYSYPTHNSVESIKSSEFYCKLISRLMKNIPMFNLSTPKEIFVFVWYEVEDEMNWYIKPGNESIKGSGYVMDSLRLIYRHIMTSESFVDCITRSIRHGFDTDTNTIILSGLASLVFGIDDIPKEWYDMIKINETNPYYVKLFGVK